MNKERDKFVLQDLGMKAEDLKKLTLRELENLLDLQKKILELTVRQEEELIHKGSRRRLEELRNEALDRILLIQVELKKRGR